MKATSAGQKALAEHYAERLQGLGAISVKRYFAGASLSCDGIQFGFVMKGVLYLRTNDERRKVHEAHTCRPFTYMTGKGEVSVASYYEAPAEIIDIDEELSEWARAALQAARSQMPKRVAGRL